jgi:hypothetical protein
MTRKANYEPYIKMEKQMRSHKRNSLAAMRTIIVICLLPICFAARVYGQAETAQQLVNRAAQAHGDQWTNGKIVDWVGSGKIAITGDKNGPLDFTLLVKQNGKIKKIVTTPSGNTAFGSDGKKSWRIAGPFSGEATGSEAFFIESQTKRSIARLFDKGNSLKDIGRPDKNSIPKSANSRIIEAKNGNGPSTRYYVDDATSLVTRLEFDAGATYRMLFGDKEYPVLASFLFSDYRNVDGVMTPFKIEVYQGMIKTEDMTFTSIRYNVGINDDQFIP